MHSVFRSVARLKLALDLGLPRASACLAAARGGYLELHPWASALKHGGLGLSRCELELALGTTDAWVARLVCRNSVTAARPGGRRSRARSSRSRASSWHLNSACGAAACAARRRTVGTWRFCSGHGPTRAGGTSGPASAPRAAGTWRCSSGRTPTGATAHRGLCVPPPRTQLSARGSRQRGSRASRINKYIKAASWYIPQKLIFDPGRKSTFFPSGGLSHSSSGRQISTLRASCIEILGQA